MPTLDKPLDELKKYEGRNPRPADFDEYWSEAIAELDGIDPEASCERNTSISPKHAECFDLFFTSVGGARIYAKYLRPKGAERCPAVFQFHGYSANSGDWSDKLGYVSEGWCVAAMDCRGQGGRSEDVGGVKGSTLKGHIVRGLEDPDPRKLLMRSMYLDTLQLTRVVSGFEEVCDDRLAAMGGSQGGGLALACAALQEKIGKVAVQFPFLCDFLRVWEMDLAKAAYEELRLFLRWHDPRHERKDEFFEKLGYIDVQHLAKRIKGEALFLTGLMDQVCPPSTQFAAYNRIESKKKMTLYPDFEHEHFPSGNDLMFNFITR